MNLHRAHAAVSLPGLVLALQILLLASTSASQARGAFSLAPAAGIEIDTGVWGLMYSGDVAMHPGTSLSLDCAYGPLLVSRGTSLFVSAQVVRAAYSTPTVSLRGRNGTARMTTSATAALLYAEIRAPARLSPFVRAGLGAANVDFGERYSANYIHDIVFQYWGFTYGFGAGLYYVLSSRLGLSLSYEGIGVHGRHSRVRDDGSYTGLPASWGNECVVTRLFITL